jgi:serine/threonine protein kinase
VAGHAAGEGRSLAQELEARGRIEVGEAARIAAGILAALGAAHSAGIIHRDVKPGNIMLADDGSVLLSDFGIAKHHADTAQTSTSKLVGSLPYMAPERLKGQDLPAGDLFALGATLYEATEGVSPFHRDTPIAVMGAVALEQPTPPQNAGALGPLTLGLLDKDPDRRPTALNALRALAAPPAAAPGNAQAPQSTPTATGWPPPAPPTAIRPTAIPGTIPLPDPGSAPTPQSAMTSLASETPCHSDTRRNPAYLWIGGIVAACVIGVLIYALGVSNGSPSGNGTQGAGAGATTSSTSSGTGNGTGTSQGSSNPTASQRQTSQATTGGSNPGTALEGQWSGNIPGYENGAYLGNAQIALDVTGAAEGQSVGTVHVVNAIADCTGDLTLTSAPSNSTESFSAQITSGNCVNQTLTPTPSGASSLDINMTPNGTAGALNLRGTLTRE